MSSIAQVSEVMEFILVKRAKALERASGFVQRSSVQLDGPVFSQMCVLTWMGKPEAGYSPLHHTAGSLGVHVSTQAVEQRFSPLATSVSGGGGRTGHQQPGDYPRGAGPLQRRLSARWHGPQLTQELCSARRSRPLC
jgi:hypothetical protein